MNDKASTLEIRMGQRLKALRKEKKFSQKKLADALKISFQQVQKYERGENRIPSVRLYRIAILFEVPITVFYEGEEFFELHDLPTSDDEPMDVLYLREEQEPYNQPFAHTEEERQAIREEQRIISKSSSNFEETRKLLTVYYNIDDPEMRKSVLSMVQNVERLISTKKP